MAEGSKTEKATPKKRRDERKKGNVFMSRDVVSVVTMLGAFCMVWMLSDTITGQMGGFLRYCMAGINASQTESYFATLPVQWVLALVKAVGPVAGATALCAIGATFAQTKLLVSGEALKPKFQRISPLQGFKRLFSLRSVIEALKGILKITILMVIIYTSLTGTFQESSKYLYTDTSVAVSHLFSGVVSMILKITLAFVALAAADFFYQWWDYERQLKMSKQEVKEEYKQLEGNPQIKGKIREIQRQMARSRMMQQVPGADVVIRNPTHVAVALRYKPERDAAPVVLAMGQDELALRIVKVAEENHVAVIENVPLARSLYASVRLNQEIPPEFYGAVAEVLVYVFKLNENQNTGK